MANTLAYYGTELSTALKSFMIKGFRIFKIYNLEISDKIILARHIKIF
jgi:hypothetical protein